jgi:hypothetical protein
MTGKCGAAAGIAVALALVTMAGSASANRCTTAKISGGAKAMCPSVDDPNLPQCPVGSRRVVYRLDKPFPLDGTFSSAAIASTPTSRCAGAGKLVPLTSDSYVIGCWSPEDSNGCRSVLMLSNGSMCLHLAKSPLGCGGEGCADLSVEQVAITNAGAAERMTCRPVDPTTSCRSARINREEGFRFIFGGLCSTMNLDGSGDTGNACVAPWGAFGTFKSRGHYDWATGAFKVEITRGRTTCGALGECLGDGTHARWRFTIVGVPDDRVLDNVAPCLNDPTGVCQALRCF